jgi:hypothetical protein
MPREPGGLVRVQRTDAGMGIRRTRTGIGIGYREVQGGNAFGTAEAKRTTQSWEESDRSSLSFKSESKCRQRCEAKMMMGSNRRGSTTTTKAKAKTTTKQSHDEESMIESLTALRHDPNREELVHLHCRPHRAPAEIEDTGFLVFGEVGSVGRGEGHRGDVAEQGGFAGGVSASVSERERL